jgi:hypothetical protein
VGTRRGISPFRCAQSDNGSATTSNLEDHMKTHAVFIRENITALVRSCGAHDSRGE